jgi:mycoredoxin
MNTYQIYLYFYKKQTGDADRIDIALDNLGVNVERISLDNNPEQEKDILPLVDNDKKQFPLVKIGQDKIRGLLFKPSNDLIKSIFSDDDSFKTTLPRPTLYCSTWCGECQTLKDWFDDRCMSYKKINIDEQATHADKINRWAGGRRVVPTIDFKGAVRLFNPGIELISKII